MNDQQPEVLDEVIEEAVSAEELLPAEPAAEAITMEDAKKRPKTTEVEDIPVGKPKKKS